MKMPNQSLSARYTLPLRRSFLGIVSTLAMIALLFACGEQKDLEQEQPSSQNLAPKTSQSTEHQYFHKQEQSPKAEWGYNSENGPKLWGNLSPDYALCKEGEKQSPIDISSPSKKDLPPIEFSYQPAKINLIYNGHTIEEKEEEGNYIRSEGKQFALKQFHFHAPSEHTVNGENTAMEMHLVHKAEDGAVAVIGVLIKQGQKNENFKTIWEYLPTPENSEVQSNKTVNAIDLLPENRDYYRYSGSFTTPPCTEDVDWFVLSTPIELSAEQIDQFKEIISGNNRPTQPLNKRTVYGP